jgi:hypothetical protein
MDIDRLTRKYLLGEMSDSLTSNTLSTNTSGRPEDRALQRSVPLPSAAAGDAGGAVSFISNGLGGLGGERLVPAQGAASPRGGGAHPTSPPLPTDLYMDQLTRTYLGADRGPPAADARAAAARHPFHAASPGGRLDGEGSSGYPLRPALRLASPRRPVDLDSSAQPPRRRSTRLPPSPPVAVACSHPTQQAAAPSSVPSA